MERRKTRSKGNRKSSKSARTASVSGARARSGADADLGGVPCDYAKAPGLGEVGAHEQFVRRSIQLAAGDEYSRRQRIYVQSAERCKRFAAAWIFLRFSGSSQRCRGGVADRDFL